MNGRGRILALALLLVPAGVNGQQGAPPAGAGTNPIERVLQRKTELALTGDQVQKLEAIRQKNAAREKELVGKITEARGLPPGVPMRAHAQASTPAERQALHQKMVAAQPQLAELRQLHFQEIQEARAVLNADQNARAWGSVGQGMGRAHGGRGPGMMPHGGPGMMQHRGPGMMQHEGAGMMPHGGQGMMQHAGPARRGHAGGGAW